MLNNLIEMNELLPHSNIFGAYDNHRYMKTFIAQSLIYDIIYHVNNIDETLRKLILNTLYKIDSNSSSSNDKLFSKHNVDKILNIQWARISSRNYEDIQLNDTNINTNKELCFLPDNGRNFAKKFTQLFYKIVRRAIEDNQYLSVVKTLISLAKDGKIDVNEIYSAQIHYIHNSSVELVDINIIQQLYETVCNIVYCIIMSYDQNNSYHLLKMNGFLHNIQNMICNRFNDLSYGPQNLQARLNRNNYFVPIIEVKNKYLISLVNKHHIIINHVLNRKEKDVRSVVSLNVDSSNIITHNPGPISSTLSYKDYMCLGDHIIRLPSVYINAYREYDDMLSYTDNFKPDNEFNSITVSLHANSKIDNFTNSDFISLLEKETPKITHGNSIEKLLAQVNYYFFNDKSITLCDSVSPSLESIYYNLKKECGDGAEHQER